MEFCDDCIKEVLKHEGGYVNHPDDPGGETNFGITVSAAAAAGYTRPMRQMSELEAIGIYKRNYWREEYDALSPQVAFNLFDAAVHSGHRTPTKWLQRLVGATADGVIGPKTVAAINAMADQQQLAEDFNWMRLDFLRQLPQWHAFSRGWVARLSMSRKVFKNE